MILHHNNRRRFAAACLSLGLTLVLAAPSPAAAAELRVILDGVTGAARDNVLALLSIYQERGGDMAVARIRRLHQHAEEEIRTALQPFGYYRPRIRASLEQDGPAWIARYSIETGAPVPVTILDVRVSGEGKDDPALRHVAADFPLRTGGPLNHLLYEEGKRNFQRIAAERGYFDQRFTRHEVFVDLEQYVANVHLHADTGRRYRFGEISIEQEVLDPELLRRYVRIETGQPYSTSALLELQTILSGTDYFGNVEVVADPAEARNYAVPVRVRLAARKPSKYTFGVGYGTDTGPRGQLGWERRYLNEQGHHVRTELRGSQIEQSLNAGYFIPIRNPRTDQLAITAGYTESDIEAADTEVRRLAISRTVLRGHLQETISLTHQKERFAIGSATGASTLLLPGVTWSYLWGEERIYARSGARAILDVRGASSAVASDTSLVQGRFQIKGIYPAANFSRFIGRVEVGATEIEEFNRLPVSLRFFAGGDVSVRGYGYHTLGPRNAEGTVVGGKHLLVGSLEYEQHLTGNWAAAVFYDIGNAVNSFDDRLQRGAGIGLRWRSPVGQVRLDAASAVSDPDRSWRLHLSIGPDF